MGEALTYTLREPVGVVAAIAAGVAWSWTWLWVLVVAGALMVAVLFTSYDVATPGWTQQYTVADATFDPIFEE